MPHRKKQNIFMNKFFNYIFVDESGDPGKPYKIDNKMKIFQAN